MRGRPTDGMGSARRTPAPPEEEQARGLRHSSRAAFRGFQRTCTPCYIFSLATPEDIKYCYSSSELECCWNCDIVGEGGGEGRGERGPGDACGGRGRSQASKVKLQSSGRFHCFSSTSRHSIFSLPSPKNLLIHLSDGRWSSAVGAAGALWPGTRYSARQVPGAPPPAGERRESHGRYRNNAAKKARHNRR